jgi:hypothetical protein
MRFLPVGGAVGSPLKAAAAYHIPTTPPSRPRTSVGWVSNPIQYPEGYGTGRFQRDGSASEAVTAPIPPASNRSYTWSVINLVRTAALLGVVIVVATGCGGRGSYAGENQRLLDSLPVYPSSHRTGDDSSWRLPEDNGSFLENNRSGGTMTERDYVIPSRTDCARMMNWFDNRLYGRGWQYASKSGEGGDADETLSKGTADVEFRCSDTFVVRADAHARG